jgi:hypothetical protein
MERVTSRDRSLLTRCFAAAGWLLPSVVPTLCCAWVLAAGADGDLARARRVGAATAGVLLLSVAVVGPVIARGTWRDLQACGLLSQAMLCGVRAEVILWRVVKFGAWRTLRALAPWMVLPCVLAGLGGWDVAQALALVACALLFVAMATVAGLAGAWTDRLGHERPAMGIPLLLVICTPGIVVALRAADPLAPTDLAGWTARALARSTPLAALQPAWADGPPRAWQPWAVATWCGTLLVAGIAMRARTSWAVRATRDPDREAA